MRLCFAGYGKPDGTVITYMHSARVTFRIHYGTQEGEELFFERRMLLPAAERIQSECLQPAEDGCWTLTLDGLEPTASLEYRYGIRGPAGETWREPAYRQVVIDAASQTILDQWLAPELPEATFLRQAFAGIIFRPSRAPAPSKWPGGARSLRLRLRAARVTAGHRVAVVGSHPRLGEWEPARALVMSGEHFPWWEVELPLSEFGGAIEFKFGLWSEAAGRLIAFEEGANRRLENLPQDQEAVMVNAEHFRFTTRWKGAGVAIPVFALRSERGYGIGEFADLAPFAEWAAACGMHLVQLLPVNDTSTDFTWKNSYPYKAISTAALHPIYLNIQSLFEEAKQPLPQGYLERREALNRLPQLDYEAVLKDKLACLRQLYAAVGAQTVRSAAFQSFLREQGDWLLPYAAFCRLRDRHGTADFSKWGEYAVFSAKKIEGWFAPAAPEHDEVMFHCFVQFHLKQQLDRALAVGHAHGVAFKGDLPIGIDRCGVEAWTEPDLFHVDRQTGAPPDFFSALGQNWGFPTYNWARMEVSGYRWWKLRLRRMSACFDALRIDHILGFFRIWEIPANHSEGIMGHFNPALPLSREEIRQRGFHRELREFLVPSVSERDLAQFFGDHAAKVAGHLLFRDEDGFFRVRADFAAQEPRQAWYEAACTKAEAAHIAEGMKRLGYEVLFLEDPDLPDRFHPRINFFDSALFASLEEGERTALRSLHDDFFYRRHTRFWEDEAMKKLPVLMDATRMLICGEDLGMIPDSVPTVLKRLGLLSLEVHNMPKRLGQKFSNPQEYPYLSVCTTSTHDTPTVRGWWEEDPAARQAYWNEVLRRDGPAPRECAPELCRAIIERSLAGNSMWCILPLQDWLAIDPQLRHPVASAERINVPANPQHYWRYRTHLTIEQLRGATGFNQLVSRLVAESGRRPDY